MNEKYFDIEVGDLFVLRSYDKRYPPRLIIRKSDDDMYTIISGSDCWDWAPSPMVPSFSIDYWERIR